MKKSKVNLATSVHDRLLNLSRTGGRAFNELLQLYAMERFLYRLSKSAHSSEFILKGALLLRVWDAALYRTTRDIDLLGRMSNEIESVASAIRSICAEIVEPDGVTFDSTSVRGDTIAGDAEYQGVRITFQGHLGNARLDMQIDVGFGDLITPAPREIDFPTLLDLPAPRMSAYPAETTIAEKFQVMVKHGEANTRMKDFHDIWWLACNREFDGRVVADAIRRTCEHRATPLPTEPIAMTAAFASSASKAAQWRAFHRQLGVTVCPEDFATLVAAVSEFLMPVIGAVARGEQFTGVWQTPGRWGTGARP